MAWFCRGAGPILSIWVQKDPSHSQVSPNSAPPAPTPPNKTVRPRLESKVMAWPAGPDGVREPRPRLARENVACRTEVACSHVSGLFTQSGWTAGPDGVLEPRPHHSSGIDVPM